MSDLWFQVLRAILTFLVAVSLMIVALRRVEDSRLTPRSPMPNRWISERWWRMRSPRVRALLIVVITGATATVSSLVAAAVLYPFGGLDWTLVIPLGFAIWISWSLLLFRLNRQAEPARDGFPSNGPDSFG